MQNKKCMVKASEHKNAHVVFSMVQRNFLSEDIVLTKGRLLYLSYVSYCPLIPDLFSIQQDMQ